MAKPARTWKLLLRGQPLPNFHFPDSSLPGSFTPGQFIQDFSLQTLGILPQTHGHLLHGSAVSPTQRRCYHRLPLPTATTSPNHARTVIVMARSSSPPKRSHESDSENENETAQRPSKRPRSVCQLTELVLSHTHALLVAITVTRSLSL